MFILQWFFDLLEKKKREEQMPELEKAIKQIVDAGCSIERNQLHIYYSKAAKGYLILDFTKTPMGETLYLDNEKDYAVTEFIKKARVV